MRGDQALAFFHQFGVGRFGQAVHQGRQGQTVRGCRTVVLDERGTNLIFRKFKNSARVAKNSVSDEVVEISLREGSVFPDIQPLVSGARGRVALETGDLDAGLIWAGQIQGLIHDIPTCQDLITRIVDDATAIIQHRLADFVTPELAPVG